jgi:hypothetical protein
MNSRPNEVIESYVHDVMRRVPAPDRNDVGLELRGLLEEMLAGRAEAEGVPVHDAMVLELLRDFGAPADIAARYQPPGRPIIPADQTRWFTIASLIGVALQWALTLPGVVQGDVPLVRWWFTWGLGSLWWPGFLVMTMLASSWRPGFLAMKLLASSGIGELRHFPWAVKPRTLDPERVNRKAMAFGLLWFAIGAAFMIATPWIFPILPEHMAQVFAYDPVFLRDRAAPVLVLWLGGFATLGAVLAKGRWTPTLRWLEIALNAGFLVLLFWWSTGDIFVQDATNDGARFGIGLVIAFLGIDLLYKLNRKRTRIRMPA